MSFSGSGPRLADHTLLPPASHAVRLPLRAVHYCSIASGTHPLVPAIGHRLLTMHFGLVWTTLSRHLGTITQPSLAQETVCRAIWQRNRSLSPGGDAAQPLARSFAPLFPALGTTCQHPSLAGVQFCAASAYWTQLALPNTLPARRGSPRRITGSPAMYHPYIGLPAVRGDDMIPCCIT